MLFALQLLMLVAWFVVPALPLWLVFAPTILLVVILAATFAVGLLIP